MTAILLTFLGAVGVICFTLLANLATGTVGAWAKKNRFIVWSLLCISAFFMIVLALIPFFEVKPIPGPITSTSDLSNPTADVSKGSQKQDGISGNAVQAQGNVGSVSLSQTIINNFTSTHPSKTIPPAIPEVPPKQRLQLGSASESITFAYRPDLAKPPTSPYGNVRKEICTRYRYVYIGVHEYIGSSKEALFRTQRIFRLEDGETDRCRVRDFQGIANLEPDEVDHVLVHFSDTPILGQTISAYRFEVRMRPDQNDIQVRQLTSSEIRVPSGLKILDPATGLEVSVQVPTQASNATRLPTMADAALRATLQVKFDSGRFVGPFTRSSTSNLNSVERRYTVPISQTYAAFGDDVFKFSLVGLSSSEPANIYTEFPVRLLSFEPISKEVDFEGRWAGGWAPNFPLASVSFSPKDTVGNSGVRYARFNRAKFLQSIQGAPMDIDDMQLPEPWKRIGKSQNEALPVSLSLRNFESAWFGIQSVFTEPGYYRLQFGVDYAIAGAKQTLWLEPSVVVLVPRDYSVWLVDLTVQDGSVLNLAARCRYVQMSNPIKYDCEDVKR